MTRLTFTAGNHAYWLADPTTGKKSRLPAVSTLLNQMAKPQLINWAARIAADYAVDNWDDLGHEPPSQRREAIRTAHDRSRNTAAAKGTTVHSFAEDLLAGKPVEVPDELQAQVQGLAAWWEKAGLARVNAEQMVWTPDDDDLGVCGYAGTLDLRVMCPRRGPGVLDIKTNASGIWPDMALQLEAYASAEYMVTEGRDHPQGPVAWTGILHVRPEGTTLHTVPEDSRRNAAARWEVLRMLRATNDPWLEEQIA